MKLVCTIFRIQVLKRRLHLNQMAKNNTVKKRVGSKLQNSRLIIKCIRFESYIVLTGLLAYRLQIYGKHHILIKAMMHNSCINIPHLFPEN